MAEIDASAGYGDRAQVDAGAKMGPGSWAGSDTRLGSGSIMEKNAHLGAGCLLREGGQVHANARVGARTAIDESAWIGEQATVGEDCWIGAGVIVPAGSIIGDSVRIGAGARFEGMPVKLGNGTSLAQGRYGNGLETLQDVECRAGSSIMDGVQLGRDTVVLTNASVTDGMTVPANTVLDKPQSPPRPRTEADDIFDLFDWEKDVEPPEDQRTDKDREPGSAAGVPEQHTFLINLAMDELRSPGCTWSCATSRDMLQLTLTDTGLFGGRFREGVGGCRPPPRRRSLPRARPKFPGCWPAPPRCDDRLVRPADLLFLKSWAQLRGLALGRLVDDGPSCRFAG